MKNNSFIFFASYYDAISELPKDEQGQIYQAIVTYAITGKQPKGLTPTAKACYKLLQPFIDSSINYYNVKVENGKKGGRPKKQKTEAKPNNNLSETEAKPNNNLSETEAKANQNLNRNKNRNNNINIYNQDKTNQVNRIEVKNNLNDADDSLRQDKKQFYLDVIQNKLSSNTLLEPRISSRLQNIFNRIAKQDTFIIKREEIPTTQILETLLNLFIGTDTEIVDRLDTILAKIDETPNISDKLKYSVSTLFQHAQDTLT